MQNQTDIAACNHCKEKDCFVVYDKDTFVLHKDGIVFTINNVPILQCENCGNFEVPNESKPAIELAYNNAKTPVQLVEASGPSLNLYCLKRTDLVDFNEYGTLVVAAPTEAIARTVRPDIDWFRTKDEADDWWETHGFNPRVNTWDCQFIGIAAACFKQGVISGSIIGD